MFEIYHREHHQFQGTWGIDTDVPSRFETKLFTNPLMKVLWLLIQPAFYVTRPLLAVPKIPRPVDLLNWINI
jgi:sphingolipid delta-4 desaturase